MVVRFFTARISDYSKMKEFYKALGKNIPKYTFLEGGRGIQAVCCSAEPQEKIVEICHKYDNELMDLITRNKLESYEVPDEQFNSNNSVYLAYTSDKMYIIKQRTYGYDSE